MGRPGADIIVDHGMDFLWNNHRDPEHGGYYWAVGHDAPSDSNKQAYGHAFVLLASSSAKVAGHPDADRLLADISTIIWERFWEEQFGAVAEEFTRDWQPYDTYRGQNSNMHLTESLMAAFEATSDSTYIHMAERIAELIVRRHAAENGWRLPEHFTKEWRVNRTYAGSPMFARMEPHLATGSSGRACCSSYGNSAAASWIGLSTARRRYSPRQRLTDGTKRRVVSIIRSIGTARR
jgi:mannose/cellobiose epimerase-like protein (N-acyl-D-glucosamine 2-epimerase family)